MSGTVRVLAGDLTAALEERVVSGLLLPYGEIGRTNLGQFSVGPGSITIPRDVSVLMANEDHSMVEPRARFLTATETPAGIVASFKVGENPEGDALLARIEEGRRTGKPVALSAEVKGVVIQAGKAIAGMLTGAAFLARGAFPSATLMAAEFPATEAETPAGQLLTAAPLEPVDGVLSVDATEIPASVVVTAGESTTEFTPVPATEGESPVGTVPNTLTATGTPSASKAPSYREILSIMEAYRNGRASDVMMARLHGQFAQGGQGNLFAALSDVTYDAEGSPVPYDASPAWVGELYAGVEYQQLVAPLIGHGDLTSKKVAGFRWVTKPAGAEWAGNKSNIPSNEPETEPYEGTAALWAGGHDHAIEHRLFNTPNYYEGYWAAMIESYKRWVDGKTLAALLAEAETVEADNPAGLSIGAAMSALIDGAAEVIAAGAVPTFALLPTGGWKSILKTPQDAVLGYLNAALGLDQGTLQGAGFVLRPHAALNVSGAILVGARQAATLKELPGTPVRVEAPDTVKGGVDTNMFGAAFTEVHLPAAFQLVTPYTA